jgi:transposase
MRFIRLTEEEKVQLKELQKSSTNHRVRSRCLCLLLSDYKTSAIQVSRLVGVHRNTVDTLFNKWDSAHTDQKMSVLFSAKGQGAKVKLAPMTELIPQLVEKHSRNLKPVLEILEKEYSIKISKRTLQNFLKGTRL